MEGEVSFVLRPQIVIGVERSERNTPGKRNTVALLSAAQQQSIQFEISSEILLSNDTSFGLVQNAKMRFARNGYIWKLPFADRLKLWGPGFVLLRE